MIFYALLNTSFITNMKKIFNKALKFIKKRWILVAIGLLIVVGIGWATYQNSTKIVYKNSYKVKRQTLKETLSFSGDINAEEKATLRFQTSGKLAWVGVKEGDTVNKFQVIASLDQHELKKTLQKDLNDYVKTRLDFDQQKDDTREVVIGGLGKDARERVLRIAQKAQYDLNNSVLDVELSNITLQLANMYSPIGGVITKVGTKVAGINVTPTQAEFEVVNPETIYFSASVDQTDVVRLNEGMIGDVTLDALPDDALRGTIISISYAPEEDETGTVYAVKLKLDSGASSGVKLRLGMTGDLTFTLKERDDVIAVPTTYIKHSGGKAYVMKKVNNKPVKTYVTVGEEIDIATIILSGLTSGDVVYD